MDSPTEPARVNERFGELLRAAQVLLREGTAEEERIVPTLALASNMSGAGRLTEEKNRLVSAWKDPEEWEAEAHLFAELHPSLRPVQVVHDILVVERLPVYVHVHTPVYIGDGDAAPRPSDHIRVGWDTEVVVAIYPHSHRASPDKVASLYRKAVSTNGLTAEVRDAESLVVERRDEYMLLIVEHCEKTVPTKHIGLAWRPVFPPPERVAEYYGLLMGKSSGGGFVSDLTTRKAGPTPDPNNLVPACVAVYLRPAMKNRREVHKALNKHVLPATRKGMLPENDSYNTPAVSQLWRDAEKFKNRLGAASYPLYHHEPEWIAGHNRFLPRNLF